MEKKYSHQDIEKRIYSQWEESGCFSASTDINNQKEAVNNKKDESSN